MDQMDARRPAGHRMATLALVALGAAVLTRAGLELVPDATGVPVAVPQAGGAFALLLLTRRARWPELIAALALGAAVAGQTALHDPALSAALAVILIGAGALAAEATLRLSAIPQPAITHRNLFAMFAAVVGAALVAAALITLLPSDAVDPRTGSTF